MLIITLAECARVLCTIENKHVRRLCNYNYYHCLFVLNEFYLKRSDEKKIVKEKKIPADFFSKIYIKWQKRSNHNFLGVKWRCLFVK